MLPPYCATIKALCVDLLWFRYLTHGPRATSDLEGEIDRGFGLVWGSLDELAESFFDLVSSTGNSGTNYLG